MIDTVYEEFIAKSRYARYLEQENRRENWGESVDRYMQFMRNHLFEKHDYVIDPEAYATIREAIVNKEILPSMRSIMTAGDALARDNTAGYNCFAGSERFITDEGYKDFASQVGTTVNVLTKDKTFKPAEVKSFGVQNLQLVTFRPGTSRSSVRYYVRVTPNHRWYTLNRGEVTNLKRGDSVPSNVVPEILQLNTEAFIRGLGFGDGTIDTRGRAKIRLCGKKAIHAEAFKEYGHCSISYPESQNGDPNIIFREMKQCNWKTLPTDKVDDLSYMYSWFKGYLAADGDISNRQPGISTQDTNAAEFIEKYAPLCGFVISGKSVSSIMETNYGTRRSPLIRFTLRAETKFFVVGIEELDPEEVFCVVEPDTQSFTLANGMLTGNCAYLPIDDPKAFDEAMFILLCGTGVGFSVERQYVAKLPEVPDRIFSSDTTVVVHDSKEGWAKSLRQLIALLYSGEQPAWDVSKVRPAGARLKTFGGRASGPGPLEDLFRFVIRIFKGAVGRKLTSLECHDIMCKIGEVVVVGGVRRSAMISLSNLSDERMRHAKSGAWWEHNGQRALANNSACYTEKPEVGIFMQEWLSLYESKSGERGIFNREAAQKIAKKNGRRNTDYEYGTNPCSEIILRPYQFCNLSTVIVRADDSVEKLIYKAQLAAILGTWQSTLTEFPYLRKVWKDNTEEERLLGVSMTGALDNPLLNNPDDPKLRDRLMDIRDAVVEMNAMEADLIGIPRSVAQTAIKPEGTTSQLTDSASGLHTRHSEYYYRRIRGDIKDPLTQFMIKQGIPNEPCVMKPDTTVVFTFPKKAPEGALVRSDLTAIQHLKLWLAFQRFYCEHKPSVTISVSEKEWPAVGAFVWEHFDEMSGVSFLPYDGGSYRQAPYEDCTKEQYEALSKLIPANLDWDSIIENTDNVEGTQTLACSANGCEIT